MKKIKYKDQLICIIYKPQDWKKGLNFITDDEHFIQVGSWWYDKDRILQNHKHLVNRRECNLTQESTYVVNGSMNVLLFNNDNIQIDNFTLCKGELAIFLSGGHGYQILEDDTKILEFKNGPFISVEKDKLKF